MEQNQGLPDDFAAQEAAARTWEPEVEVRYLPFPSRPHPAFLGFPRLTTPDPHQGPLLGDKTTIAAITEQYAKADPIYVDKTIALPQTYSHYRPVKGDGNCGWRAIGFCYFELLIQQGSKELVDGEHLRLTQLNNYLVNSGNYDPDLFVDFVEDTFELLKQISDNIHDPDTAMAILTTKFNDMSSINILFHLRLLAGAWLRGNRDQYAAWCEADPETYAQTVIEPAQREIEELGVVLLVEVLLKPVGFTLEIAYLDRSQGSQVNTHRFPDGDPNDLGAFIHLLYRPGHYDVLYKPAITTITTSLQVNRMAYTPTYHDSAGPQFEDTFGLENPLALIPGFGTVGPVSAMGQLTGSSLDYPSSPQSPWFPSPYADSSPTPPAQPQPSQQTSLPTQSIPGPTTTHEIRFSRYQYAEPMDTNAWPEQPLQTNTFKNSHFNTAHYNNPNFQPEEYRPGDDDGGERCERPGKKKGHHKAGHSSSEDSTGRGGARTEN
ncbi:peptidase C65 Otubain-domain-containing protein [Diaporthe sp. PMI_573]|nr:peptidase C65 Otubain-domain-containing protein [Diaporthaceae sp. PMI_573]